MPSFSKGSQIKMCLIRTPDGSEEFNLTPQIGIIKCHEDILDPSFHIELLFADTIGYLESVPIRSGSELFLRIETPSGTVEFEKESLVITNIATTGSTTKKEMFVLECESKEAVLNPLVRLSLINKAEQKKPHEIVKKILKEELGVQADKMPDENFEEPQNVVPFSANQARPLQFCTKLATQSIPVSSESSFSKGGSGFFFCQTLKGFVFKSPNNAFKEARENKDDVPVYEKVASFDPFDERNNFHIASEPIWQNSNNLYEQLYKGQFFSHNTFFDINERKHVIPNRSDKTNGDPEFKNQPNDGDDDLSNVQPHVPPKFFVDKPSRILVSVIDRGTFSEGDELTTEQDHVQYEAARQSRYSALFSQTCVVTVPLNLDLTAGSVVFLKFPRINIDRPHGTQNPASGFYMIKSLSHEFGTSGDFTGLKCVRDAYSELK